LHARALGPTHSAEVDDLTEESAVLLSRR